MGVHFSIPFLYWNHTESEPKGLYLAVPGSIQKGDLVVMKVPDHMKDICYGRGWMKENETMLKTVAALERDWYEVRDREFFVNGVRIGFISETDSHGLPLPQLKAGKYVVEADFFLPIANQKANSFDGRYFGPVSKNLIVAKVVPIYLISE